MPVFTAAFLYSLCSERDFLIRELKSFVQSVQHWSKQFPSKPFFTTFGKKSTINGGQPKPVHRLYLKQNLSLQLRLE